ncbi:MAG: DUF4111 domain-containing protein [Anaerolineae bacterium]|nr:DUF4111 domain-containing protein [Anaerolineae bacterium]
MDANTYPPLLQPLFEDYLRTMQRELPGYITGFYLHGSLALGAFQPHTSDIDCITTISRRSTDDDVTRLAAIHQALETRYPDWPLSVSYLQWGDLGQFESNIEPYPCYHDSVLHPRSYNDINAVTWWLLKHRGVTLYGPSTDTMDFTIDWDRLVAEMHDNMNTYWAGFTRKPARIAWLWSDYGVQWAVLGVLRQFYTFREQAITSKVGAGEYALEQLPARWHPIIQEALTIRNQAGPSRYRSRATRARDAFLFLRYVIRFCNKESA